MDTLDFSTYRRQNEFALKDALYWIEWAKKQSKHKIKMQRIDEFYKETSPLDGVDAVHVTVDDLDNLINIWKDKADICFSDELVMADPRYLRLIDEIEAATEYVWVEYFDTVDNLIAGIVPAGLEIKKTEKTTNKTPAQHIETVPKRDKSKKIDVRAQRLKNLPNSFTIDDWRVALSHFGVCCAVCGHPLDGVTYKVHRDHWIPITMQGCPGTVAWNMVPLCSTCNHSKHSKHPDVWLRDRFGEHEGRVILRRVEAFLESRKPAEGAA